MNLINKDKLTTNAALATNNGAYIPADWVGIASVANAMTQANPAVGGATKVTTAAASASYEDNFVDKVLSIQINVAALVAGNTLYTSLPFQSIGISHGQEVIGIQLLGIQSVTAANHQLVADAPGTGSIGNFGFIVDDNRLVIQAVGLTATQIAVLTDNHINLKITYRR